MITTALAKRCSCDNDTCTVTSPMELLKAWLTGSSRDRCGLPRWSLCTSMPAQVLGQREITAGGGVQHWVSFRLSDGREVELQATPSQAYVVYPGQDGTLHFAGERVTGWVPALAGGPKDSHSSD